MAYGKGRTRDMLKRMADLGRPALSADLTELRARCLDITGRMARAGFTGHVTEPVPEPKALDTLMLCLQSEIAAAKLLNVVWVEKCRLLAKSAITEQMKRRQRTLFGRFRHIDAVGERPMHDGTRRLTNLPPEWSHRLGADDLAALRVRAEALDFRETMGFFARLHAGDDQGLSAHQAEALRAMMAAVQDRFQCPQWGEDASVQLHLDYRCVKGTAAVLEAALTAMGRGIDRGRPAAYEIAIASHTARGPGIGIGLRLDQITSRDIHKHQDPDRPYRLTGLALELGPSGPQLRGVLARPKAEMSLTEIRHVLSEDFGLANTSSMTVLALPGPIDPEALPDTDLTKAQASAYLRGHVSGEEIRLVESLQLSGRNFLARINEMALAVDRLRSEIDLTYNRLDRIRAELNRLAGLEPRALVPEVYVPPAPDAGLNAADLDRHARMHARFFRILSGLGKLKARRRGIYRSLAGLKKSWFGHVANIRLRLAQRYKALVVSERLDFVTIPTEEAGYKGRTFNRMINNGARAQYTSRADDKLDWSGVPRRKIPSFYTSATDWRHGRVDKAQRRGAVFAAAADERRWDADLHAAEMIGRWLFLRPKTTATPAQAKVAA